MKVILASILLLIFSGCSVSESPKQEFLILNPEQNGNELWVRHLNLPAFDPDVHSDGCSGGMSALYNKLTFLHKTYGKTLQWRQCCEDHDRIYYYGGSSKEKKQADRQLNACITEVIGHSYLGDAMQIAVEIGGAPYLPTSYRWGYGEDFREGH